MLGNPDIPLNFFYDSADTDPEPGMSVSADGVEMVIVDVVWRGQVTIFLAPVNTPSDLYYVGENPEEKSDDMHITNPNYRDATELSCAEIHWVETTPDKLLLQLVNDEAGGNYGNPFDGPDIDDDLDTQDPDLLNPDE